MKNEIFGSKGNNKWKKGLIQKRIIGVLHEDIQIEMSES